MKRCETIILAKTILTQNANRDILHDSALAINNGLICDINDKSLILHNYFAQDTIDLGNALIMPGLINGHAHTPMVFLRGLADDQPLWDWLTKYIFPLEQLLTTEIVYYSSLLAFVEKIRSGTTAVQDMYMFEREIFKAADQIGIRICGGETIIDSPTAAHRSPEAAILTAIEDYQYYAQHSRISTSICIHGLYTTKPATVIRSVELAQKYKLPIHIHLAENASETEQVISQYGKRPVQLADELGLLTPMTSLAHCVDLLDEELDLLAERQVNIIHNPKSNLKLGSGIARIPAMLQRQINVALGTDGAASNNMLNMFSEMQYAALIHKGGNNNPTLVNCQQVLDMATLNGAKAGQFANCGSLIAGNKADLIALDLNRINLQAGYNWVSDLIYATTGDEIIFSMIDGKVVYRNGCFNNLDYPGLIHEMHKIKAYIQSKVKG